MTSCGVVWMPCQLVETSHSRAAEAPSKIPPCGSGYGAWTLERCFPHCPAQSIHDELNSWIGALASDTASEREGARAARFAPMRDRLIEAQQLEILHGDVPSVIEDARSRSKCVGIIAPSPSRGSRHNR